MSASRWSISPRSASPITEPRASLGLNNRGIAATQTILKLSYGIQLNPAVRLMPNLQYVIDPQPQEKFALRPRAIPDAVVIGAKPSVDLFTLAGLATRPGSN